MARKKKIKFETTDFFIIGGAGLLAYLLFKPESVGGGTGTGGSTGGSTGGGTGGGNIPAQQPSFIPSEWASFFVQYAVPSCYFDCSNRYHAFTEINTKLTDTQIKQVSDVLFTSTGKNMKQHMDTFSFYGGPYTNNNGTLLYNRLTSI
jgi:hypothetical protein